MAGKILVLGFEERKSRALEQFTAGMGYMTATASWDGFHPRRLGRERIDLALVDADARGELSLADICLSLRKRYGENLPVLAFHASRRFADLEEMIGSGVTDCLPGRPTRQLLERKLVRWLPDPEAERSEAVDEPPPVGLVEAFRRAGTLSRLGDLADIHVGVAPRQPTYRRLAPPDDSWLAVIPATAVGRFQIDRRRDYLSWNRRHLFRMPDAGEYNAPEKVVLTQNGPPLAAALDRSRSPIGHGLYAIVPRENVLAGFLACVLNSRLVDFYYNRLAKPRGAALRPEDLRSLPLPLPGRDTQAEMSRNAVLLTHFGPSPAGWIDRRRCEEMREATEEAVFSLYGLKAAERAELAALHF